MIRLAPVPTLRESEAGYSLVESIVAIALLATVLAPLSAVVVQLTTHRLSEQKIEALGIAQHAMEAALLSGEYQDASRQSPNERWLINESYRMHQGLVVIRVTVSKLHRPPLVTLQTARLAPVGQGGRYALQ